LSEPRKIFLRESREWLEKETGSIFIPVHEKAQEFLHEMKGILDSVSDVCSTLSENSRKEIEKRSRKTYGKARALNKLARLFSKRIGQIKVPDEVSYDSFHDFVQETRKAFTVTEVDIRNWFPRISPFFIMDRRKFLGAFEKASEFLKKLESFQAKEYVKTKKLEETFQIIDNLLVLQGQLADLEARKKKNEMEKASIERKIAETQQKMTDLRNRENLSQLNQLSMQMEKLRKEVKHNFRHFRKPFIKFQSQVFRKGGLTPEELEKLNRYIEDPFDAFSLEKAEYPILRQILRKLASSMSEGKLKLKSDRKRKAEQDMERIFRNNSLDDLHQRCHETIIQRRQLSTSEETANIKENLSKLHEEFKGLKRTRKRFESEEDTMERKLTETQERIRNQKDEIEKNVSDFVGENILIEV